MMPSVIQADASPEKRLFISLITRDITLIEAFLDMIDNSVNAALEPMAAQLKTADDYERLLSNRRLRPRVDIDISVASGRIVIRDNAAGITTKIAREHAFKFGRDDSEVHAADRLSVYGIGLKRAMFKCGNKIAMVSDHREGGFSLRLDVREWASEKDGPWQFAIASRPPTRTGCGTTITISDLHDEVLRRLDDGLFVAQLRERIAGTYSYFIGRIVNIKLNGALVDTEPFDIGINYSSAKFRSGSVSCNITAGISRTRDEVFRYKNAGWFVFCNGRTVLSADKSITTGWAGMGLPIFQPKHRPFLGTVFFVSPKPEDLPWATTKASINEEIAVWQEAKRHMVRVGRTVIEYLDKRYAEDGTRVTPAELQRASGAPVSVLTAATAKSRTFKPPREKRSATTRIQYEAKIEDVTKIAAHLRRPAMTGSEVGRYTFNAFLKNEIGEEG